MLLQHGSVITSGILKGWGKKGIFFFFKLSYGHYIGVQVKCYVLWLFCCKKELAPWAMWIQAILLCMADGPGVAPWSQCPGQCKAAELEVPLGYTDEGYTHLDPVGR